MLLLVGLIALELYMLDTVRAPLSSSSDVSTPGPHQTELHQVVTRQRSDHHV